MSESRRHGQPEKLPCIIISLKCHLAPQVSPHPPSTQPEHTFPCFWCTFHLGREKQKSLVAFMEQEFRLARYAHWNKMVLCGPFNNYDVEL